MDTPQLVVVGAVSGEVLSTSEPMAFDGPFPVTVGLWEAVTPRTRGDDGTDQWRYWEARGSVGAIVATVPVTGPSHRADECWTPKTCYTPCHDEKRDRVPHTHVARPCHPGASRTGRHTPVDPDSLVHLDVPVPCERPDGAVWWPLPEGVTADA